MQWEVGVAMWLPVASERRVHPRTRAGGKVRRRQVPQSGTPDTVEGAGANNVSGVLPEATGNHI